jgi:3,4-dihydroxy 2-butanone 4-phosphate synthase/GTP cyclohydrolase II
VSFAPIDEVVEELKAGRMIVLVDDEKRENEGDLVCAGQFVTPTVVNFMVTEGRGMLCVAMSGELCDKLELPPQSAVNTSPMGTGYTLTVDAHERYGITTGVSASDRSATIRKLAEPDAVVGDFSRPGHIQPLRARDGGVLVRTGQTEGSVDLCRIAGLEPVAAIIEIMNEDGTMARLPELEQFCAKHHLKMSKVADIVAHRLGREHLVQRGEQAVVDTDAGQFNLITYRSMVDPFPHVVLGMGRVGQETIDEPVLVRVHAQNLVGDVFGDQANPTGQTLRRSMQMIAEAGEGAVLYLRQDALESGTLGYLKAGSKGEEVDEVLAALRADARFNVGIGSQILRDLGIRRLRLLTDHPQQYHALDGFGIEVSEFVPLADGA